MKLNELLTKCPPPNLVVRGGGSIYYILAKLPNGSDGDAIASVNTGSDSTPATAQALAHAFNHLRPLVEELQRAESALTRLVLAWSRQPLMITHDDGERLNAMASSVKAIEACQAVLADAKEVKP